MEKERIKKIAVIGPESSGKSTLCQELAEHFQTLFVPEYAREHLLKTKGEYVQEDLVFFAEKQQEHEELKAQQAFNFLFCDTDLHNICVWSQFEYGDCIPQLQMREENQDYDFYLLCAPDLPWVKDELRQNENLREELFLIYQKRLVEKERSYAVIKGKGTERLQQAICEVEKYFSNSLLKN